MKNLKRNKKSWFKGLVVTGIITISVLNLTVEFQRDSAGEMSLALLSAFTMAQSGEDSGNNCGPLYRSTDFTQYCCGNEDEYNCAAAVCPKQSNKKK